MTVTTSYPGIYIQELPSLSHTISPAPTSIAVFVGYTHPFLTPAANYGKPIQLFSFSDYQNNFGGFFYSPWQPDHVGQAVWQFFLNGGSSCFVVGLQATSYHAPGSFTSTGTVVGASVEATAGAETVTFTARQPVGVAGAAVNLSMQVVISNLANSSSAATNDIADVVVTYGTTVETYRKLPIASLLSTLASSSLVSATATTTPTEYPTTGSPFTLSYPAATVPDLTWSVSNPADFGPVFEDNAPLDKVPIFNLLVLPGVTNDIAWADVNPVLSDAIAYCERKRAFFIMDTPSPDTTGWDVDTLVQGFSATTAPTPPLPISTNAAVYYPWLATNDPVTGAPSTAPPSGFVAGVFASEDATQGVWKSPAGIETSMLGTTGVVATGIMTDMQQGVLNNNGVDCIRQFPGVGTVVFGARTLASTDLAYEQWKYVAVRRMALFIEQTLYANLTWALFKGNDTPLWNALVQEVSAFMLSLFRQGAFAGSTPSQAFLVQCDSTTTTPTDVANGVVNVLVGFAPLSPAEFVVIQIAQLAGQAQS